MKARSSARSTKPAIRFAVPDRNICRSTSGIRDAGSMSRASRGSLAGPVDLVEKQKARDPEVFEFAQDKLKFAAACVRRLRNHHRRHRPPGSGAHVMRELHRTGAVDKSVTVAHETGRGGGEAGRPSCDGGPRGWRRLSRFRRRRCRAGNCASTRQNRFKKCGFTALERAHQRNAPWTARTF